MARVAQKAAAPPRPPPPQMNFKAFTGGGSGDSSGSSFAAARALFEAAKKPENRALASAAANNPVIRNAAVSAAKNPQTRGMMLNAASSYASTQQSSSAAAPALPPKPAAVAPPPQRSPNKVNSNHSSIMAELEALNLGAPPPPRPHAAPLPAAAPAARGPGEWANFGEAPSRPPPPSTLSPTTEPYGVVKYPYNGSHFDELSCTTGDVILLKKEVDDQWIYGMLKSTGKFGIFPQSFLDVRIPLVPTAARASASSSTLHSATALFDYNSGVAGDLSFYANAQIRVIARADADWLEGECDGRRGIFPASYVQCTSLSSVPMKNGTPAAPAASVSETVTAAYDYNSGMSDDLAFYAGDVIEVVQRIDAEWMRGRLRGATGLVPLTYVTSSSSPAMSSPATPQHSGRFPVGRTIDPPQTLTAISDHHSTDGDMLYFSAGDQLLLTEIVDDTWAKGKLAEFRKLPAGYFPRNLAR